MTTKAVILQREFSPIGLPSSPTSSGTAVIVSREFSAARPLPLPNTTSLVSLVGKYESDPKKAALLKAARQKLAVSLYVDQPHTLALMRLRVGLSQAQLAQRVGTSQSHIARIELGQTDPTTDVVSRLAKALDVDASQVFTAVVNQRAIGSA